MRLLIAGRTLPDTAARLLLRQATRPLVPASGSLRELPDRGLWVRLAEQPGQEFVFGAVGRFWGARIEWRETKSEEFVLFTDRGWGQDRGERRRRTDRRHADRAAIRGSHRGDGSDIRLEVSALLEVRQAGMWLILGRVLTAIRQEAQATD